MSRERVPQPTVEEPRGRGQRQPLGERTGSTGERRVQGVAPRFGWFDDLAVGANEFDTELVFPTEHTLPDRGGGQF